MAGQLTIDTLKASSGVLATQNGMAGIAKAWVNFNGTPATPTIRSSFNVGSVTKLSTGKFQINFATNMPDSNYATCYTGGYQPGVEARIFHVINSDIAQTASNVVFQSINTAGTAIDSDRYGFAAFSLT